MRPSTMAESVGKSTPQNYRILEPPGPTTRRPGTPSTESRFCKSSGVDFLYCRCSRCPSQATSGGLVGLAGDGCPAKIRKGKTDCRPISRLLQ